MKIQKALISAALVIASVGSHAATNLVQNGSFEQVTATNSQNNRTWNVYQSIVGWTGVPNIEVRDNVAGIAQHGSNFVELDTHRTTYSNVTNSMMYQDILGTGAVEVSFWYSARPRTSATTNDLIFSLGSFSATVLHGVGNSTNAHVWTKYTKFLNLENDGVTRLSFSAAGVQDTYGGSLDNVVITTAVPEPETYAMLLAGLGLMGTIVRRRSNKKA